MKDFIQHNIDDYEQQVAKMQLDIEQINDEIYKIDQEIKPLDEQISNYSFKLGRLDDYIKKEEQSWDELFKVINKIERDNIQLQKHKEVLQELRHKNIDKLDGCRTESEKSRLASRMLTDIYNELRESSGFKIEKYK